MFSKTPFDLNKIADFHPALVYGFDAESSLQYTEPNTVGYLLHIAGQSQDMFDAYIYAQNEILPTIKKSGIAAITEAQLSNWINQIHLRIAATLAADTGVNSGEYTRHQVLRWHQGLEFQDVVVKYITGELPKNVDILQVAQEIGYDKKSAEIFLKLLLKIRDDKSIVLLEDQKRELNVRTLNHVGLYTLNKLVAQYYTNRLTKEERAAVDTVVKICWRPIQIPEKMRQFISELLKKWQACDPNDAAQVIELTHFTFYGVTENHAFFNANGRSATCLMNIVLRSLGKSSILMRFPSERDDPASSYSQAIRHIDSQPELLKNHIKKRIAESKSYADTSLAEITTLRVKAGSIAKQIKQDFPECNFEKDYAAVVKEMNDESAQYCMLMSYCDISPKFKLSLSEEYNRLLKKHGLEELLANSFKEPTNSMIIFALHFYLKQFEILKVKYTEQRQRKLAAQPTAVVQKQYSEKDKTAIIDQLATLTAQKDWKPYKTNGLTLLLELKDHDLATKIVSALQKTAALQAKLNRNPTTKDLVIKIDSINTQKLLAIKTLAKEIAAEKSQEKKTPAPQ